MTSPPTIRIDLASKIPAYRQIVDAIRALLVGGLFEAGQQLPTVRELAIDLGIHHNTVAEAYRVLAEEGWLALGRRRGATVLSRAQPNADAEARGRFARRLRELIAEARGQGIAGRVVIKELISVMHELQNGEGQKS